MDADLHSVPPGCEAPPGCEVESGATPTGLGRLVPPDDLDRFFDAVWERAPQLHRVQTAPGTAADAVLDREQLEFYLRSPQQGAGSELSIVHDEVARPVVGGGGSVAQVEAVYGAYAAGDTILLSRVQLRNEAVADLCAAVEHDLWDHGVALREPVGANAYLTPVGSRGFGPHYDDHCAFVMQLSGRKAWTVFAPDEELPVEPCPVTLRPADLGQIVLQATLVPGDVLYVPRGFPHAAACEDDHSLHLTLSVRATTWADAVAARCRADVRFRRSLRRDGDRGAGAAYVADVLAPALARLPLTDVVDPPGVPPMRPAAAPPWRGRLAAIDGSRHIGPATPVERAVELLSVVEDGDAQLRYGGGAIRLEAAMAPVFDFLASARRFTPGELPEVDRPYDPVELTRLLVQRGLLRPTSRPAPAPTDDRATSPHPTDPATDGRAAGGGPGEGDGDTRAARSPRGLRDLTVLHRGAAPSVPRIDWVQCAQRLSDADCDEIVAACSQFPQTPPTTVGEDRYPAHRRAITRKVGLTPRTRWIFELLCDAAATATRTCFGLELSGITRAPQYVEYTAGHGQFDRHNDYSHDQADSPRKVTAIIQLSDPGQYAGGRLRVFGIDAEDLPDERGTVLLLPSFVYHQVTPVERGTRRALVAWIAGPRLR